MVLPPHWFKGKKMQACIKIERPSMLYMKPNQNIKTYIKHILRHIFKHMMLGKLDIHMQMKKAGPILHDVQKLTKSG